MVGHRNSDVPGTYPQGMHLAKRDSSSMLTRERFTPPPPPDRQTLRFESQHVVIERRQRGGTTSAVVIPQSDSVPLTSDFVRSATGVARQLFGRSILVATPAITQEETTPFLLAGFETRTVLNLLTIELKEWSLRWSESRDHSSTAHREHCDRAWLRGTNEDSLRDLLTVDRAAFGTDKAMDSLEFASALRATQVARVRTLSQNGDLVGFALIGRAGRRGYLQRLAVHPAAQGQGVGRMLVQDVLGWSRRHRIARVVVNTEETNAPALQLYRSTGFRSTSVGLFMLDHTSIR